MAFNVLGHSPTYPPLHNAGGPQTLHGLLKAGRDRRGWNVRVLVDGTVGAESWEGIPITTTRLVPTMREMYRASDVIITQLRASRRAVALSEWPPRPLVHLVHNTVQLHQYQVPSRPNSLAIFNTFWMSRAVPWSSKSTVLHPIVDVNRVRVEPLGSQATLVNKTFNKGADIVYDLARLNPSIPFLVVEGGYGIQMKEPDLANVQAWPNAPEITSAYSRSRVMVAPSAQETWGLVAVEAALSGIPTIGSLAAGFTESDVCWRLIDRADIDGWSRALNQLIFDLDVWEEASARALERAALVMELIEIEVESALDEIEALV